MTQGLYISGNPNMPRISKILGLMNMDFDVTFLSDRSSVVVRIAYLKTNEQLHVVTSR